MISAAQALEVRSKMIGVLVRAARVASGKSLKECAEWLGSSTHVMSQYEYGRGGISLPEIELLAALFHVPVNHLWNDELADVDQAEERPPTGELLRLRHKEIGVWVRQARMRAGKTQAQCAELLGVSAETIGRYEYGDKPIPFSHLELLADLLDVGVDEVLDKNLPTSRIALTGDDTEVLSPEDSWARLPDKVKDFLRNPGSLPYLEMAIQFYGLPKDYLRQLAEAMLTTEE